MADLLNQSDRGAALIAGSFVDAVLALALQCHLVQMSERRMADLFEGPTAPLGTFAARIGMGRALGVFGDQTHATLQSIKGIRNVFAHALRPLDFNHELVVAECVKLAAYPLPLGERSPLKPARVRYTSVCIDLCRKLYEHGERVGGRDIVVDLP